MLLVVHGETYNYIRTTSAGMEFCRYYNSQNTTYLGIWESRAVLAKDGVLTFKTFTPAQTPNPRKLKFTGAVSAEYDGSSEVTVEIPEGGGGSGLPTGGEPHQMLVTDAEGNATWEKRTHWEENTVMLPETQVYGESDSGEWPITTPFAKIPRDGDSCTVNWNGVEYSGVARTVELDGVPFTMLGNLAAVGFAGADDNGQPFIIGVLPDEYVEVIGAQGLVMPLDGSEGSVTISITGGELHKIPDKFINYPDPDVLIVECTSDNITDLTTIKPNKTFAQVEEAFNAGRIVIFRLFGIADVRVANVSGGAAYAYMSTPTSCTLYTMRTDKEYLLVEENRLDTAVGLMYFAINKNGQITTSMRFTEVKTAYEGHTTVVCRFEDAREGIASYLPLVSYNANARTAVFGLATNERYIKVTYTYNDNAYEYLPVVTQQYVQDVTQAKAENAGKLLYVADDGTLQPLTLGAGLSIVDGVLTISANAAKAVAGMALAGQVNVGDV